MRRISRGTVAAGVAVIVLVAGCGSEDEATPSSEENLFREYVESTDVENDRYPTASGHSSEDRLATFAAYADPQTLQGLLLSAFLCEGESDVDLPSGSLLTADNDVACEFGHEVRASAEEIAGADPAIFGRSVLVKHGDDSLELVTVYVVERSDGTAALIDSNGETYTGGLRDFRENNDLLDPGDLILVPRDITAVPGEGEIVTVSGHTATGLPPWLIGGVGVIVLATGLALIGWRSYRRRQAMQPDDLSTEVS
jgi:hypothetical protein